VIGANSLVAGNIPPCSLAVGSPAKVIRSAPDFPKRLSAADRSALVVTIMAEFDRFVQHGGVTVQGGAEAPLRLYRYGRKTWRLLWLRGDSRADDLTPDRGDTVLTEIGLSPEACADFARRGVYWLDLDSRTRSDRGSRLTEELVLFLGRYGVRLSRYVLP